MTRNPVSRRTALKRISAGAGAIALLPLLSDEGLAAFADIQRTAAPPSLKALTAEQYATLEALTEAIIPADERSPGAKQARVADYIDLLLSEADETRRQQWTDGLAALDADATARFGKPFLKLDAAQVETVLTDASKNENAPALQYKGNKVLLQFVGCQTVDGKDCPHCGQKAEG